MKREAKWITFNPLKATGVTSVWEVKTKAGLFLGVIKWMTSWRKYAFFPSKDTVYESTCMLDIVDFLSEIMAQRVKPRLTLVKSGQDVHP